MRAPNFRQISKINVFSIGPTEVKKENFMNQNNFGTMAIKSFGIQGPVYLEHILHFHNFVSLLRPFLLSGMLVSCTQLSPPFLASNLYLFYSILYIPYHIWKEFVVQLPPCNAGNPVMGWSLRDVSLTAPCRGPANTSPLVNECESTM